jgi:hypothetical protein
VDVKVFELGVISNTIKEMHVVRTETEEHCNEGLSKAENVLQETQAELSFSETLLNAVKVEEAVKLALKVKAEARMAKAMADESAAIASGNPIAIAAANAEVASAAEELARATEEYEKAVRHRERIEKRCEMALKCVNIAKEMVDTLHMRFNYLNARVQDITMVGINRLQAAYDDLIQYISRLAPDVRREISEFYSYEPEKNRPISPKNVHDRLNATNGVLNAILEYLYFTDLNFHESIARLCAQLKLPGNEESVNLKVKRNVVGRLCEELVIRTFLPMGERILTQDVYNLPDGSYTKVDMILYGLKEPLILGRGSGKGAAKGGSLGIEVKSGHKEYLFAQMEHLEKQAQGHKDCSVSVTVCTRDITNLPPEKQEMLRAKLADAGSPLLGMLPYKDDLDSECIRFVKDKAGKNHV